MTPSSPPVRQLTKTEEILLQRAVQKVSRWRKNAAEDLTVSITNKQSEGGSVEPEGEPDPLESMKVEAEHFTQVACLLAGKRLSQQKAAEKQDQSAVSSLR